MDASDPVRWEIQTSGPAKPRRVTTARFAVTPPAEGLLPPRDAPVSKETCATTVPGLEHRLREVSAGSPGPGAVPRSGTLLAVGVVLLAIVFVAGLVLGQVTAEGPKRPSTAAAPLRIPPDSQLPPGGPLPVLITPNGNASRPHPKAAPHAAGTARSRTAPRSAPTAGAAGTSRTGRGPVPPLASREPAPGGTAYRRPAAAEDVKASSTRRPVRAMARRSQSRVDTLSARPKSAPVIPARAWPKRAATTSRNGSPSTGFNQRVLKVLDRLD